MAKLLGGTIVYGTGTVQTILYVQGTTSSTSTASGALQVVGGAGIGGNLYVGGTIYGTFSGSVTGAATSATNIVGGSSGSIPIQSAAGITTFINTGSVGNILQQRVGNTATFVSTGTLQVGYSIYANTATNVAGGTAGQLHYQSGVGATSFAGPGNSGQLLMSSGTSAPLYVNTASVVVGNAVNIAAGTAGQLHYQSSVGTTAFVSTGSVGQLLMSSGTSAPLYVNTSSIVIGNAANIAGGLSGFIPIQSGVGTTAFIATGTVGYLLQMQVGNTASWVSTASITAPLANTATNISGGVSGQLHYQSAPGVTSFVSTGTRGDVLVSNGSGAPTYNNTLTLTGTTAAVSIASGALQVGGGVGISGDAYLGGSFIQVGGTHGTLAATYNLINTTATTINFAGAGTTVSIGAVSGTTTVKNNLTVVGNLTIQGTTTVVDSTVTNISDPIITLGGNAGNTAPSVDDNKDRGVAFKWFSGGAARTGFFGYQDSTGFFTFISSATIANEVVAAAGGSTKGALDAYLAGGTAQSLVYQSSPNVTSFLAAGTSGFILQTNGTGSAPSWVSATGLSAGSATTATNADNLKTIATTANSSHYISFVDSNNTVAGYEAHYTTSSFFINPATKTLVVDSGSTTNPGAQIIVGPSSGSAAVGDKVVIGFKLQNTVGGGTGNSFAAGVGGVQDQASNNGGALAFYTQFSAGDGTPERMRITNAGNVGIGTTAPTGASGLALAINGGANQTRIALKNSTTGDAAGDGFQIVLDASGVDVALEQRENGAIRFNTNSTERMRITALGGISFGATGTAYGTSGYILKSNGDAAPTWVDPATVAAASATNADNLKTVATSTNATYYPSFVDSNNAAAAYEAHYTTSSFSINPQSGNLNVGTFTTSIAKKLTVVGEGNFADASNNTRLYMGFGTVPTTGGTGAYVYNNDNSPLVFGTSNTERMRIDSSGNIVLGYNTTATQYVYRSFATGHAVGNRGANITFGLADGGGVAGMAVYNTVSSNTSFNAQYVTFTTHEGGVSTAERMRITSLGGISFGASGTAYGTAGQILQSNGNAAPTWVSTGTLTAGIATTSSQLQTVGIATNASYYPSFVDSNNASATAESFYTTSSFSINPSTGVVTYSSAAVATSTSTGALRVTGGVGVGGDLYAKDIYTNGVKAIPLNIQEFTATAAQTTFTVTGGYTVGTVQVFANGINLGSGDFTASNGTTVVVSEARKVSDIIRIISGGTSSSINNIQSFSIAMSVAMAM